MLGNITDAEERMLWRGRTLWHERVENGGEQGGGDGETTGKAQQAGKMDASAQRKWEQFKSETNS